MRPLPSTMPPTADSLVRTVAGDGLVTLTEQAFPDEPFARMHVETLAVQSA